MAGKDERYTFYNNNSDTKGYFKKNFYEDVISLLEGEELSDKALDLMLKASQYELGKILEAQERKRRIRKDPLESDYALGIVRDIVPLLDDEPKTINEIMDLIKEHNIVYPGTGKLYGGPYIGWVLGTVPDKVEKISVKGTMVTNKGFQKEVERVAYKRAN